MAGGVFWGCSLLGCSLVCWHAERASAKTKPVTSNHDHFMTLNLFFIVFPFLDLRTVCGFQKVRWTSRPISPAANILIWWMLAQADLLQVSLHEYYSSDECASNRSRLNPSRRQPDSKL